MIAAEDFSYYLQQVSGTFWWIGAGTPEQGCVAGLYNVRFTTLNPMLKWGIMYLILLILYDTVGLSLNCPHSSLKCNRWRSFTAIYFPGSLPPQTFPRAIV